MIRRVIELYCEGCNKTENIRDEVPNPALHAGDYYKKCDCGDWFRIGELKEVYDPEY